MWQTLRGLTLVARQVVCLEAPSACSSSGRASAWRCLPKQGHQQRWSSTWVDSKCVINTSCFLLLQTIKLQSMTHIYQHKQRVMQVACTALPPPPTPTLYLHHQHRTRSAACASPVHQNHNQKLTHLHQNKLGYNFKSHDMHHCCLWVSPAGAMSILAKSPEATGTPISQHCWQQQQAQQGSATTGAAGGV
jgi:hypothetical protein